MPPQETKREFSRRDFLAGALATGALSAAATYLTPGGRAVSSVAIRFVTGADPTGALSLLIEMWNRANPLSVVSVDPLQGSTADQRKAMIDKAAGGAADVLNLDVIDIPYFHQQGYVAEVELEDVNGFLDKCVLTSRLGDPQSTTYWAVPFNADVGMLFWRLRSDTEPVTKPPVLSSVIDTPRDAPEQFVAQLSGASPSAYEAFVVNVLEHALSRDATILDPGNGTPTVDVDRWRAALGPLRTAVTNDRIARVDTEDVTRDGFRGVPPQSPRPYMRNWPVKYRELQQLGDVDARAARVGVGQLPVGILGGQSLAVAAKARNVDRATDFIRFMTGLPAQKVLASYGLAPTRRGAYEEPSVQAFVPHLKGVRDAVDKAQPRPVSPRYSGFTTAVQPHFSALLDQGRDLTTAFVDDMKKALGL